MRIVKVNDTAIELVAPEVLMHPPGVEPPFMPGPDISMLINPPRATDMMLAGAVKPHLVVPGPELIKMPALSQFYARQAGAPLLGADGPLKAAGMKSAGIMKKVPDSIRISKPLAPGQRKIVPKKASAVAKAAKAAVAAAPKVAKATKAAAAKAEKAAAAAVAKAEKAVAAAAARAEKAAAKKAMAAAMKAEKADAKKAMAVAAKAEKAEAKKAAKEAAKANKAAAKAADVVERIEEMA
jgi:hypothetical protein